MDKVNLKHFKIGVHEKCAFFIIAFALLLRIILIAQGWPQTNSDEGTLGLMALHIAYRGEHPIFFYGQGYMGSFEAYLAALLFQLFGSSLFILRLGLVLLFALFLVSIYFLTSLLYTKNLALAALCLLSLGSEGILWIELRAIGGYAETLLCGTLLLLLATWLSLSFSRNLSSSKRWMRYALYGCWGLIAGFSIWTDLLVLPFFVVSGLLLVVFCWPEWKTWAPLCLILTFSIGVLPAIVYNLTTSSNEGTLYYFFRIYRSDVVGKAIVSHILFSQKVLGTLLVGIPNATGANPICPNQSFQVSELFSPHSLQCTLFQGSWSLGCILLWAIAVFLNIKALWNHLRRKQNSSDFAENRQTTIRYFARLMLLSGAALTVILFALSPVSALDPWTNSRYLFCLLIATPAVIAPLWQNGGIVHLLSTWREKILAAVKIVILIYISVMLVMGIINVFKTVPEAQAFNQRQDGLIANLLRVGATHIYSEYWTCDRVIFQSEERIICGVVNDHLQEGYNRYEPYYSLIRKDPRASYVFPLGSPQALNFGRRIAHSRQHFQRFIFDGYIIYKPV